MAVMRWRLQDPANPTDTYTFPISPNTMSSPFPARMVTTKGVTAIDGQVLMWEGPIEPQQWSFGGSILDAAQYEALRSWVYDRQGRMFLWDHFGRRYVVVFKSLSVETTAPAKRQPGRYWYHTYTIEALVVSISAPTVGDEGPA